MRRRFALSRAVPVLFALLVTLPTGGSAAGAQAAGDAPAPMIFPVLGAVTYSDTFGAPRSGGRTHDGQDLLGPKMLELVAAADGRITYLANGSLSGNMLKLTGDDGWVYSYLHLNNDTPGTDDGQAARADIFGPGIEKGVRVVAGQLLGYLGDSGNAEATQPHLHFELASPSGATVNPYEALRAATRIAVAVGSTASPIPRLAGIDRENTAILVSQAGWQAGAADVVIAAQDRYNEALPATVLAAARSGPLLLSGPSLSDAVRAELDRLRPTRVTVIGSVSQNVEDAVRAPGRTVDRLGVASDPTATAIAAAGAVGAQAGVAVLVNGSAFADGISATAIAAGRGWPVLLTSGSKVPQSTVDTWRKLGVHTLVLVGGPLVIPSNIESWARTSGRCAGGAGCTVERLAGADRYATSVAVVQRSLELGGRSAATLLLGTGTGYADLLSSGPLASRLGGLALLIDGSGAGADAASRTFLAENAEVVKQVTILGGSAAVTSAADRAVQRALGLA